MKNAILFPAALLLATDLSGQFSDPVRIDENDKGVIVTGDFNGDGAEDVISISEQAYFYQQTADNQYMPRVYLFDTGQSGANDPRVFAADMDQDGDKDLVFITENTNDEHTVHLYANSGTAQFAMIEQWPSELQRLAVINHNGDALPDIALLAENGLTILENTGNNMYQPQVISLDSGQAANWLQFDDADGDGTDDLFLHSSSANPYYTYLRLNDGNGTYGPSTLIFESEWATSTIVARDLTQDGITDIILAENNADIYFLEGQPSGTYVNQGTIGEEYHEPDHRILIADLDNDSKKDILYLHAQTPIDFTIYKNYGFGMFMNNNAGFENLPGVEIMSIDIANINEDDYPDIALNFEGMGGIYWLAGNGEIEYSSLLPISKSNLQTHGAAIVDMDGDGYDEIIISESPTSTGNGNHRRSIFKTDTDGRITHQQFIEPYQNGEQLPYSSLVAMDFEGDGDLDVFDPIVEIPGDFELKILRNDAGVFNPYTMDFEGENMVGGIAPIVQDRDGDGLADLTYFIDLVNQNERVYLNQGEGSYPLLFNLTAAASNPVLFADVDSDGDTDAIGQAYYCEWRRNNSNQSYDPEVILNSMDYANLGYFTKATDWDMDGDLDLVGYHYYSSSIHWFENTDGSGNFSAKQLIDVLSEALILDMLMADVDSDGDDDIIALTGDGLLMYQNQAEGNPLNPTVLSMDLTAGRLATGDVNHDGNPDILVAHNSLSVLFNIMSNPYQLHGVVYHDINGDGLYGGGEPPLSFAQIQISGGQPFYLYSSGSGQYTAYSEQGEHTVSISVPDGWALSSSNQTYTTELTPSEPVASGLDFGLVPATIFDSLTVSYFYQPTVCNGTITHGVSIMNSGTTVPSGLITLELDSLLQLEASYPEADSVSGNFAYWTFDSLGYFEHVYLMLSVQFPSPDFIGSNIGTEVAACTDSGLYCSMDEVTTVLSCAYDPNDKTSHLGWTGDGFVLPDTPLEYTVRFQNTGNSTATDVRIEDPLSSLLDWSSLHLVAYSHEITELMVNENGRLVVRFDNIMLPDSSADGPASHGFVRFGISQQPGLSTGEVIYNAAEIYFDLNPPVITNTTTNTILDCSNLADFDMNFDSGCPGTYVQANADSGLPQIYEWEIDGQPAGPGPDLYSALDQPGNHVIMLMAENPICSVNSVQTFTIFEPTVPGITLSEGVLSATGTGTFQWYLDGVLILGADESALVPGVSGIYTCSLLDLNGCYALSDEFTFTGVEKVYTLSDISLYPNPAADYFSIRSHLAEHISFHITNSEGRIVSSGTLTPPMTQVRVDHLSQGYYILRIEQRFLPLHIIRLF